MLVNGNFKLKRSLKRADSYEEWMAAALAYDKYNGLDRWREKDQTRQYDHVSIRTRHTQVSEAGIFKYCTQSICVQLYFLL